MTKVAIFGGGVGGLTVAHELRERGFEVDVYEKNKICGGKARSLEKGGTGTPPLPDLPGEHGFRFFPGFYQHLDDTMKRIPLGPLNSISAAPIGPSTAPIGPSTAFDNLVDAGMFAIAQEGKALYKLTPDTPKTLPQWIVALDSFFGNPELGLAPGEKEILLKRILRLFAMCRERREKEYECVTWWDYHNVPIQRSAQYNKMFVTGFSRAFVAMDAQKASTMTGGNTLAQFFRVFFGKGTMDRVLNAPTNDAWLSPWVAYLSHKGVNFHQEQKLTGLNVSTGAVPATITSATVENTQTNAATTVTADYYVAAVPVEVMTPLAESNLALTTAAPSLNGIKNLEVSWMTGIMFYLSKDVPIVKGHVNFADSKWALTGISQPQFWPNDQLSNYGDGTLNGLLSIVISDWTTPGDKVHVKTAEQCTTPNEVADETWKQLVAHLPNSVTLPLGAEDPVDFFLDPAISFPQGGAAQNAEPLLTNTACSLSDRPRTATAIQNLMLAADYVRTNVDIATMEGANEAGRRAANAVIAASGSGHPPCGVWDYPEPQVFDISHAIDKALLEAGGPSWGDILFP
ncbi:MAG: FAD-dependent oxidoreductase [Myxococcales bacterium]|nr:FAD-dependent oxidoreductase [Myxococcales bacterium]MDH3842649.1 FAD-dependent oxidoreductase [Myxococcales bacterium]